MNRPSVSFSTLAHVVFSSFSEHGPCNPSTKPRVLVKALIKPLMPASHPAGMAATRQWQHRVGIAGIAIIKHPPFMSIFYGWDSNIFQPSINGWCQWHCHTQRVPILGEHGFRTPGIFADLCHGDLDRWPQLRRRNMAQ